MPGRRAGLTCTLHLGSTCSARPGLPASQASARQRAHTLTHGLRRDQAGVRGPGGCAAAVLRAERAGPAGWGGGARRGGRQGGGGPGGGAGRSGAEVARGAQERGPSCHRCCHWLLRGGELHIRCLFEEIRRVRCDHAVRDGQKEKESYPPACVPEPVFYRWSV